MTKTAVTTISTRISTHRLVLTNPTSKQPNSFHAPIFDSVHKKSLCSPMLLSLTNPAFPDESAENFLSESSNRFQLPLEIIDQQLCSEESQLPLHSQVVSSDDKNIIPSDSSARPHSPLHTNDRGDSSLKRTETSRSSAEIENMLHSWGSDHFKISSSPPYTMSPCKRNHIDQETSATYSGMKRSPLCSDLRRLNNFDSNGESINSDHFHKKRRSIDESSSIIDNQQFEFESTLFF